MPTRINDKDAKAAKKREALARAKQWNEERNGKSPASTKSSSKAGKKPPTPTRTSTKDRNAEAAPKADNRQYAKTPSREERAKYRARAKANAREWSEQRKKKKTGGGDEKVKGFPANIFTNEEDMSDSYKTAPTTPNGATLRGTFELGVEDVDELNRLKGDLTNTISRFEGIVAKFNVESVDRMDID